MSLATPRVREHLAKGRFSELFTQELGWDRHSAQISVVVDDKTYVLKTVAQKRGVQVFDLCVESLAKLPDYNTRKKIEKQVTQSAVEHLIVFRDAANTVQIWQWVARQPGEPDAYREHSYRPGSQSGDLLIQKLAGITIPFSDEEAIDLTGVVHRLRDSFDRDRVTKQFYDHFKREHAAFLAFIKGITDQGDRDWYASLMLNRLMFVYFIQKKGFLDGNVDYLQDRLAKVQAHRGKGKFHSFYRYFLLCLFHEGFGKQPATRTLSKDLVELLGDVPYLNGGLFDPHELEQKHEKIDIADEAFERLFGFFDQYEWHLDTRPLRNDREINPDVLGYIFEKYINQKEMGAYYTKEDITDNISKNTIIPFLFDAAEKNCAVAFQPNSAVWRQLSDNPDRYIYPAVRHGVVDDGGQIIPLPSEIKLGIADSTQRDGWTKPAKAPFNLPTETWREHVTRRQRYLELRTKLAAGEVQNINNLITLNLNIRQFAADTIASCEGPELVRAFYQALVAITVLDPTCGSGAFLFAALNILEPLYEACLDRMQAFVDDLDRSVTAHSPKKFEDFRRILADVARHPNRTYFILKSIIVRNIYGVDIMEEAVEICKLRLFLKLVAQIEKVKDLEPLPDIDFNIRPGNTLVGFATLEDVKTSMEGHLDFGNDISRIVEEAEVVDRAFEKFHEMQTTFGMDGSHFTTAKKELRNRLDELTDELDGFLAGQFGIAPDKPKKFAEWQKSHQPFHWFAEFYGILRSGGFDVVLGNPPYVEVPQTFSREMLTHTYHTALDRWSRDEDLYTFVVERSFQILAKLGRFGMILPLSLAFSTKRPFHELRKVVSEMKGEWWWSHFDRIPSALFGNDVRTRCTIAIYGFSTNPNPVRSTTALTRWTAERRDSLFPTLTYSSFPTSVQFIAGIPKVGSQCQANSLAALLTQGQRLEADLLISVPFSTLASVAPRFPQPCVFIGGTAYNWFPVWRDIPETTDSAGRPSLPARTAAFRFRDEETANVVFALLASALGYWWWAVASDGFNLKKWLLDRFPLSIESISADARRELARLGADLRKVLKKNYVYKDNKGRIGNYFLPACATETTRIDAAIARHVPQLTDEFFENVRSFNLSFSRASVHDEATSEDEE